jgi:hypothetical protein
MVRLRLLSVVCLVTVLVPCGRAQTDNGDIAPSEQPEEGRLGGEKAQLVAWRAHDAVATHDHALVAELVSLAGQWQPLSSRTSRDHPLSPAQEQERDAMMAILDALLQVHVLLPTQTLRNLAPDFANPVAIFLSRMPLDQSIPLSLQFYRSLPEEAYALRYMSASFFGSPSTEWFCCGLAQWHKSSRDHLRDSSRWGPFWMGFCWLLRGWNGASSRRLAHDRRIQTIHGEE